MRNEPSHSGRLTKCGPLFLIALSTVAACLIGCGSDDPQTDGGVSDASQTDSGASQADGGTGCTLSMSTNVSGSLDGTPFPSQTVELRFVVPVGTEVVIENAGGPFQSYIEVPSGTMTVTIDGTTSTVTTAMRFTEGFAPGYVNLAIGMTDALTELLFSDEIGPMPFETDRDVTGSGTVADWTTVEIQTSDGRLILDDAPTATGPAHMVRFAAAGCE